MAPSNGPVRWVASDVDGLPLKRKQVAQACELCRKRKKRCNHAETLAVVGVSPGCSDQPGQGGPEKPRKPRPQRVIADCIPAQTRTTDVQDEDATQVAANRLVELSSSRFVGDLNPEGIFIQAATRTLPATPSTYRDSNDLGVWFPPYSQSEAVNFGPQQTAALALSKRAKPPAAVARRRNGVKSLFADAALRYEQSKAVFARECLSMVPSDDDYGVLRRIYCEKIHPLFPVLNDAELGIRSATSSITSSSSSAASPAHCPSLSSPPSSSPPIFPTVIRQLVSLAAATTDSKASAPHLRLDPIGLLLGAREFHRRLADAISTTLEVNMTVSRFDHIRALILLSFFYQPSGEADRNKPALFCSHAVHHFQTIGAHLHGYRPQRLEDDVDRIFCSLFALDRFCSILYARPLIMHMQDSGKTIEDCIAKQPPCFRLFMQIVQWIDRVILLYRPRQPFVLIDIPVFESLILDAEAEKLPAMHLATIEVLYHTVCVLSCRQPGSAFSDTPSTHDRKHLPLSIINPRRSHSADRIVWVTQTQPICCLPFVPYAVSLALSVQYKKMRYSRTPMFRTRGRALFKEIVGLLKSMGDVFLSVRVNAALGESIWKQMEKTANSLAREELEGTQQTKVVGSDPIGLPIPPANSTVESMALRPDSQIDGVDNRVSAINNRNDDPRQQDIQEFHAVGQQQPAPLLDLSVLDNLDTDVDLFGNFDPSFDLGAVDTALESNLDMGIPQYWNSWNHLI